MKKRFTCFISGALTTALIGSLTLTALAASGTVSFNSVNLRFNGTQISAKGENYTISSGASVPSSILYTDENGGGTTHLPVARVSELLGVDISWDGTTGSVVIGEKKTNPVVTPDPVGTISDYSDWSVEEEAAYQEFKAMWVVSYREKHAFADVVDDISSDDFIAFLEKYDSRIEVYANRFIIEIYNASEILTDDGNVNIYFQTYGICVWGGGFTKRTNMADNTYDLKKITTSILQLENK